MREAVLVLMMIVFGLSFLLQRRLCCGVREGRRNRIE